MTRENGGAILPTPHGAGKDHPKGLQEGAATVSPVQGTTGRSSTAATRLAKCGSAAEDEYPVRGFSEAGVLQPCSPHIAKGYSMKQFTWTASLWCLLAVALPVQAQVDVGAQLDSAKNKASEAATTAKGRAEDTAADAKEEGAGKADALKARSSEATTEATSATGAAGNKARDAASGAESGAANMKAKAKKKVHHTATEAKEKAAGAKAKANDKVDTAPGGNMAGGVKSTAKDKVENAGKAADTKADSASGAAQTTIDKMGK